MHPAQLPVWPDQAGQGVRPAHRAGPRHRNECHGQAVYVQIGRGRDRTGRRRPTPATRHLGGTHRVNCTQARARSDIRRVLDDDLRRLARPHDDDGSGIRRPVGVQPAVRCALQLQPRARGHGQRPGRRRVPLPVACVRRATPPGHEAGADRGDSLQGDHSLRQHVRVPPLLRLPERFAAGHGGRRVPLSPAHHDREEPAARGDPEQGNLAAARHRSAGRRQQLPADRRVPHGVHRTG